ncbi:MAG: class I SAM-dependent methyltransferase [Anaerolineae bacterium]|nr:MAG: class I SAM-dependent methyltransferase [Anaerolineae bacterium]
MDTSERVVLPLLDFPQNGRVLDVGCGNGGISFLLAELRPDLHISGVDFEANPVADAAAFAERHGLSRLHFEQGDAHQLRFADGTFDGAVCQTVLTHVRDAPTVVREMARVLKVGGVFSRPNIPRAARSPAMTMCIWRNGMKPGSVSITASASCSAGASWRWGAAMIRWGRVPLLATQAGMDVYDVRLNDRVMHVFPPYRHEKQRNYLELSKRYHAPAPDDRWFNLTLETILAGGGTEADARWYYAATDSAGILQAIEAGVLSATGSFALYLTFARKPLSPST